MNKDKKDMHSHTDLSTLRMDITVLFIALSFVFIEFFQRGIVIYTAYSFAFLYPLLSLVKFAYQKYKHNKIFNQRLEATIYLCRLCLISSISTTLLGHSTDLNSFKSLLIALIPASLIEYHRALKLIKTSNAISLYLLYCLWITLTIWATNINSPQHVTFYMVIASLGFILSLLVSKDDYTKKAMAYVLATATTLTTIDRGVAFSLDPSLEPAGLLITYKNLAAFVGLLAISMLLCLKPRNSLSAINMVVIGVCTVAIYLTPSQGGKIGLLIVALYMVWLYGYRTIKNNQKLKSLVIFSTAALLIGGGVALVTYHKELSKALGRKETIGGRTTIWETTIDWIRISPVIGNGGSFWQNQGGASASNHHHEYVNRGYNGFLDTLVQSGVVGLMLLVFFMITLVAETKLRWGEKFLLILAAMLTLVTETHSFAGTFLIFGGTTARAILVFWLAFCLSQTQIQLAKRRQLNEKEVSS